MNDLQNNSLCSKHQSKASSNDVFWFFLNDKILCKHGEPFTSPCLDNLNFVNIASPAISMHHLNENGTHHYAVRCHGMDTVEDYEFVSFRQLAGELEAPIIQIISTGIALLEWHQNNQYCGSCGNKTTLSTSECAVICQSCDKTFYPKIQPCIIVAITRINPISHKKEILLAKHHRHKESEMYGLIAGYMEVGETAEQCVHREVKEEVGLTINNPSYLYSQSWPYPCNLMLGFVAEYESGEVCAEPSEIAHAQFFELDNLPKIPPKGTIAHDLIQYVIGGS